MFSFFNKKPPAHTDYFPITVDMHSHVIPGLDDGSPDVETSLRLVRGMVDLGIKKIIATPHVISDLYRNTPDTINSSLVKLKQAVKENDIPVEIHAGAEYMLDSYFFGIAEQPVAVDDHSG